MYSQSQHVVSYYTTTRLERLHKSSVCTNRASDRIKRQTEWSVRHVDSVLPEISQSIKVKISEVIFFEYVTTVSHRNSLAAIVSNVEQGKQL